MNKYVKNGHIINATQKAYEVLYKDKGYKPCKKEAKESPEEKGKEDKNN